MDEKETLEDKELIEYRESVSSLKRDYKTFKHNADKIATKLEPYHRPLIYLMIMILMGLIFFAGFGSGGFLVCMQLDGVLDVKFYCHVGAVNNTYKKVPFGGELVILYPYEVVDGEIVEVNDS